MIEEDTMIKEMHKGFHKWVPEMEFVYALFIVRCVIIVAMQKLNIALVTSGVVVAMLVATAGIIAPIQIASASNVGGNGNPPTKTLKGGGTGPANG